MADDAKRGVPVRGFHLITLFGFEVKLDLSWLLLVCKDAGRVVDNAERAGLARTVARLAPVVCIKGWTAGLNPPGVAARAS